MEKKKVTVHYATSDHTVCGVYICGGGFDTSKSVRLNRYENCAWESIQHTCNLDSVNCARCLNSHKYKEAMKCGLSA